MTLPAFPRSITSAELMLEAFATSVSTSRVPVSASSGRCVVEAECRLLAGVVICRAPDRSPVSFGLGHGT